MLNIDILKANLPEKDLDELNFLLNHPRPELFCGLAVATGTATPICIALAATLPATLFALSLGFTFAAVSCGIAMLFCATRMLLGVEAQKALLFLSKPAAATANVQEVLTKTLNISPLSSNLKTIASIFCQVTTFVFAGLWMPLCWITPGYTVLIPIFGGLALTGIMGLLTAYFYDLTYQDFHLQFNCEAMMRRRKL